MDNTIDYQKKYLKYKFKYLELKKQYAGNIKNSYFNTAIKIIKNQFIPPPKQSPKQPPKYIPKWLSKCNEINESLIRNYKTPYPCVDPAKK